MAHFQPGWVIFPLGIFSAPIEMTAMIDRLPDHLVLATRRSPLAIKQTEMAQVHLAEKLPGASFSILPIVTTGDQQLNWALSKVGGKGLFTGELEKALLEGSAHLAVHSAKDLPTAIPPGLELAGFLPRADPRDVLIRRVERSEIRTIACGSPRRRAQVGRLFPGVEWREIRGSVETRLRKIAAGEADATLLAAAGLQRLGISSQAGLIFEPLSLEECVPATGQAAIAIEVRTSWKPWLEPYLDASTGLAVRLERYLLSLLGGGCHSATAIHYTGEHLLIFQENTGCLSWKLSGKVEQDLCREMEQVAACLRVDPLS